MKLYKYTVSHNNSKVTKTIVITPEITKKIQELQSVVNSVKKKRKEEGLLTNQLPTTK